MALNSRDVVICRSYIIISIVQNGRLDKFLVGTRPGVVLAERDVSRDNERMVG